MSISELWHGEEFNNIINDLELHSLERSFFGNLNHKKKNGEIASMRFKATRLNQGAEWVVYLFQEKEINKNKQSNI